MGDGAGRVLLRQLQTTKQTKETKKMSEVINNGYPVETVIAAEEIKQDAKQSINQILSAAWNRVKNEHQIMLERICFDVIPYSKPSDDMPWKIEVQGRAF